MKLWVMVLLAVLIFDLGFVLGACWRAFWADMPIAKPIEADAARYMMRGEM